MLGTEASACSSQSILTAMDRFVKSVSNMDATVLVPSKLRDMDVSSGTVAPPAAAASVADMYAFFGMLNDVKKELLWGNGSAESQKATTSVASHGSGRWRRTSPHSSLAYTNSNSSGVSSTGSSKHARQPSDESLRSLGSTASSDHELDETDSEVASSVSDGPDGASSLQSVDESSLHLAAAFKHHLQGLHTILHQLADSADHLSSRYQEDLDAGSSF